MQGLHLTADLHKCRCDSRWLADAAELGRWCADTARAAGLEPVNQLFHRFDASGNLAVTLLLADESQLQLQTDASRGAAALDLYLPASSSGGPARALLQAVIGHLAPQWTEQRSLDRGDES